MCIRDRLAPIHVAETGQFRAHEIERVGHHADLAQLFGEELDILEVDVIDPIFKFIERLQIVDLLPDEVGGIIVDAEVFGRQKLKNPAPDRRRGYAVSYTHLDVYKRQRGRDGAGFF